MDLDKWLADPLPERITLKWQGGCWMASINNANLPGPQIAEANLLECLGAHVSKIYEGKQTVLNPSVEQQGISEFFSDLRGLGFSLIYG